MERGQLGKRQDPAGQLPGAQIRGYIPMVSGSAGVMYPHTINKCLGAAATALGNTL